MARCSGCGEEMAAGLKFCTRCGKPAAVAGIRCVQCGAEQAPGKRFCVSCGSPLGAPASPAAAPPPPQGTRPANTPPVAMAPPPAGNPAMPYPPAGRPMTPTPPAGSPPASFPAGGTPSAYTGSPFPATQAVPAAAPKRGGGGLLVAVLLIAILGALGVGGYLAYRHLTGTPTPEEPGATTVAEAETSRGPVSARGQRPATATRSASEGAASSGSVRGAESPATSGEAATVQSRGTADSSSAPNSNSVPNRASNASGTAATVSNIPEATGDSRARPPLPNATPVSANESASTVAAGTGSRPWPSPSSPSLSSSSEPLEEPTAVAAPRGWGSQGAESTASSEPVTASAGVVGQPLSGVIIWSGPLRKNGVITIDGSSASVGSIRGALPGVPVRIETDFRDVGFSEMPSRSNGWKRFSMRGKMNGNVVVTLRWRALR